MFEYPPNRKLRPVVQQGEMVYRTRNSLTPSRRTITDRAACGRVTSYGSIGLSSPTPYVTAAITGVFQLWMRWRSLMLLKKLLNVAGCIDTGAHCDHL